MNYMKEFQIDEKNLKILNNYGWLDCKYNNYDSIISEFSSKYNKELSVDINFNLTHMRINSMFNQFSDDKYPIHIYLLNKNGLYFIHGNNIYLHNKDFTKDREYDFNNIIKIIEISDNLENDIKRCFLMSDNLIRDIKIDDILNQF